MGKVTAAKSARNPKAPQSSPNARQLGPKAQAEQCAGETAEAIPESTRDALRKIAWPEQAEGAARRAELPIDPNSPTPLLDLLVGPPQGLPPSAVGLRDSLVQLFAAQVRAGIASAKDEAIRIAVGPGAAATGAIAAVVRALEAGLEDGVDYLRSDRIDRDLAKAEHLLTEMASQGLSVSPGSQSPEYLELVEILNGIFNNAVDIARTVVMRVQSSISPAIMQRFDRMNMSRASNVELHTRPDELPVNGEPSGVRADVRKKFADGKLGQDVADLGVELRKNEARPKAEREKKTLVATRFFNGDRQKALKYLNLLRKDYYRHYVA